MLSLFIRIVQTFENFASQLVQQEDFSNITVIAEETLLQAQRVSWPLLECYKSVPFYEGKYNCMKECLCMYRIFTVT